MTLVQKPSQSGDGHAGKGWRRFGDGYSDPQEVHCDADAV